MVADALVELPASRHFAPGKPDFEPVIPLLINVCPSHAIIVTERSELLIKLFHLGTAGFVTDSEIWPLSPAYQYLKPLTEKIKVLNDFAEWAIKDVLDRQTRHATHATLMMS